MEDIGRILILVGVLIAIVGGSLMLFGKIPGFGKLPGDIVIQRNNFTCMVPLVDSVLLSIVLTIVLNLIFRIINK